MGVCVCVVGEIDSLLYVFTVYANLFTERLGYATRSTYVQYNLSKGRI